MSDTQHIPSEDEIFDNITRAAAEPSGEAGIEMIERFLHASQSPLWGSVYWPPVEVQEEIWPEEVESVREAMREFFEFEMSVEEPYGRRHFPKTARLLSRAVRQQLLLTDTIEWAILEEPEDVGFEYPLT